MKGYEDVAAGLALLATVLVGGYFYLQSETFHQKQNLQQIEKRVELKELPKVEKKERLTFAQAVKSTE